MARDAGGPANSALLLLRYRRVLWQVTRNELRARYAGSLLGATWALLAPLLLLGVYAVVYLFVFRVQVPGLSPLQYVLYIFAGLAPFLTTAEAIAVGVTSVVANRAVLNSTVFPIDLVPAKAVLGAQGPMLTGFFVIVAAGLATNTLSWSIVALPGLVLLHMAGLLGTVWVLALLNVAFRDLQSLVNIALMVLLVASPIAYTPEMVPPSLAPLVALNPLAYLLTAYQRVLVLGQLPDLGGAAVLVTGTLLAFGFGGWFFANTKRMMADHV